MAAAVSAEDRKKHAVGPGGSFPIKNKAQARSAIRLRGHAKTRALRRAIIRRAASFLPGMAKQALEADKKAGRL